MDAGEASRIGPYRVVRRIAVGGMAEIFEAREQAQAGESRTVVLKRMLPQIAARPSGQSMFAEEARIAGLVRHPNVVGYLSSGSDGEQPYHVLEYVPGCDLWRLGRWLRSRGQSLDVSLSIYVALEVLAGLQAVHQTRDADGSLLHIVHQDVSPSNVLLSHHGEVKLGDFGIARAELRRQFARPSIGAKGKLGYLAPEQVAGERTDSRSDVFSCAVVVAELLMGKPLFQGGSELAILLAIRDASIAPLLATPLPEGLLAVLQGALSKEPTARPSSAEEFAAGLRPYLNSDLQVERQRLASLVAQATGHRNDEQRTPHQASDPLVSIFGEKTPQVAGMDEAARAPEALPSLRPRPSRHGDAFPDPELTPPLPPMSDEPPTAKRPQDRYEVFGAQGHRQTLTFALLVQAINIGELGPDDLVAPIGGFPRKVSDSPELLRHLPMSTLTPVTKDTMAAAEADIRRNFAGGGFLRAIAETAIAKDTGLWLCEQGGVRKEIYVQNGVPEFVSSNLAGEMLGEFLVQQNVISRGELDMSLAVLPRFDGRLGDTLVALGLVEPLDLFQHIGLQVREKLLELFHWPSGTACFYRGVIPPPSGFPLGLDVWQIIDEGIERRLEGGLEEKRFARHMMSGVAQVPQLPLVVREGDPPALVRQLLDAVAEPQALPSLIEALETPTDPRRGYRAVVLGLALEVVRWV